MNVLVCRYNYLQFETATVQDNRAMRALDVSLGSVHCGVSENIDLRTYCPSMIRQASSSHNQSSLVLVSDCDYLSNQKLKQIGRRWHCLAKGAVQCSTQPPAPLTLSPPPLVKLRKPPDFRAISTQSFNSCTWQYWSPSQRHCAFQCSNVAVPHPLFKVRSGQNRTSHPARLQCLGLALPTRGRSSDGRALA